MKIKRIWQVGYSIFLVAFTAFVLLDAYVIPRSYAKVESHTSVSAAQHTGVTDTNDANKNEDATDPTITDTSYNDGSVSIKITSYREYDTDIYVAEIILSDPGALKTAFAYSTYGKNITEVTSAIAFDNNAILAINGDYYGVRDGYVIRNGVLYRSSSNGKTQEDLVISSDGSFRIIEEGAYSAEELLNDGAWQVISFGPGLLENGQISVETNAEVSRTQMASNPRTAIGILDDLHYIFVVSDGRTKQSAGLSLYELAEFMQELGVQTAYNLDGGGSSTMVFNGTVINTPTSGKGVKERAVSDIVFIG